MRILPKSKAQKNATLPHSVALLTSHRSMEAVQPVAVANHRDNTPALQSRQSFDHPENIAGTACECVCGGRVVWKRALFAGNVKETKEHECEHDICPYVNIPGLHVVAQCTFVKDVRDLTAGTLCLCQCGDK